MIITSCLDAKNSLLIGQILPAKCCLLMHMQSLNSYCHWDRAFTSLLRYFENWVSPSSWRLSNGKILQNLRAKEAHVHAEGSSSPSTHTLTHSHTTLPCPMYTPLFLPSPGEGVQLHANLSFHSSHDPRSKMVKLASFPEFTHPVPDHLWYANHSHCTIQWEWSAWQPLVS